MSLQAEGRIGYDINVIVNNSTSSSHWGWSHYTTVFSMDWTSQSKGDGNSSKYIKISGIEGINLKETTATKEGRLKEERRISLASHFSWLYIDEVVSNRSERYQVKINESMPASLLSVSSIMYRGEGIRRKGIYINNADTINTDYQAKKFSESSAFLAIYQNALITADLTPSRVLEFAGENYSTVFRASTESDRYTGFRFRSRDDVIEEDYIGSYKMSKYIKKVHEFHRPDEEIKPEQRMPAESWLPCCSGGLGDPSGRCSRSWLNRTDTDCLFGCSCYIKR